MILFQGKYGMQIDDVSHSSLHPLFFSNSDAAESKEDAFFLQGFNEI